MKNKFLKLISLFFIAFIFIESVSANEIAKVDNEVLEEGNYDSLRLIAGNMVKSRAIIDGLSFAAGNNVDLEGSATYGFYAGNKITVKGKVEKDIFAAGNEIIIDDSAVILRDAYFAGNSVVVNANIARDLRVGSRVVNLSGVTIGRDAYIDAEEIILDSDTVIEGVLSYSENAKIEGLEYAKVGTVEKRKIREITVKVDLKDVIYNLIVSIIASFIVMTIVFYLLPNTKERLNKTELNFGNILKYSGIGLLMLVIIPLACIIGLFTGVLVPLSLITMAIYVISIYLSKIAIAYIIGSLINTKIFKNDNTYLSLAIGLVILKSLILIPIIGGYISFISMIYGLGLICNYIIKR